jgi:hypothetical protein
MGNWLRILGWIVLVGGSCTSIGVFWIDHMNGALWALMVIGIAASVVVGLVLRWLGVRVDRARLASDG